MKVQCVKWPGPSVESDDVDQLDIELDLEEIQLDVPKILARVVVRQSNGKRALFFLSTKETRGGIRADVTVWTKGKETIKSALARWQD